MSELNEEAEPWMECALGEVLSKLYTKTSTDYISVMISNVYTVPKLIGRCNFKKKKQTTKKLTLNQRHRKECYKQKTVYFTDA